MSNEQLHPMDEMKAWMGFTQADSDRLGALLPVVAPHLPQIAERFYAAILRFPRATGVFADEAQVERLGRTLQQWLHELLSGPHDLAYYERRTRIGVVHVQVGLPQEYMFTAMNQLRRELLDLAERSLSGQQMAQTCQSILKITDLDLAVMMGTYVRDQKRKEMEELRDLLVAHLPITALLLDASGRVTSSTGPLKRRFLSENRSSALHYSHALAPEVLQAVDMEAILERVAATRAEYVVPRFDVDLGGLRRSLRLTVVPLDHPVARTLLHFDDLSEVLAFEARIRQNENLTQLGAMSAAIAHEIRNPLAGISGTMQVVMRSLAEDDRRRGALSKVLQQIDRLNQLVEDLLQFSKPISAHCSPTDLRVCALRVASGIAAAGLGSTDVKGSGSAHADGPLLQLALHNLVQNAWQAGAQHVELRIEDGLIRVFDNGPGIPPEKRADIFRPFFTTRLRGTGLGLPNARRIVEAMGGTLELGQSPLGGAGFEVRLLGAGQG